MKKEFAMVAAFLMAVMVTAAQVRLPRLIRDSMILQRESGIQVWGWASAGEKVSVKFREKTYRARTNEAGKWMVRLPPSPAGGPFTMEISGKNKILLHDILIGDVWVCSGQSNMVHQMQLHSVRYHDEVEHANYPEIRQFWIPTLTDLNGPREDLPTGYWKSANPVDVRDFSAVAYFFAKTLYDKYHIPIGLINASVGGSPIEAWTSEEGLKPFPDILKTVEKNKDSAYINGFNRRRPGGSGGAGGGGMSRTEDKGLAGPVHWYDPAYVPKGWKQIGIPGYWEDQGVRDLDGSVWYRKEIDLPAPVTGVAAKVFLGRIVDADFLYINGQLVGNTTYMYPQRRYPVPAGLLKAGKNLFVVRVINNGGKGGFVPDKPYCLIAGSDTIDLKGYWQYKVGEVFPPRRGFGGGGGGGFGFSAQNQPAALYNAMLAPVTHYTVKGFLWYQGESNTGRAAEYAKLQPALIADWRNKWQEGELPFLFVQLPGFGDYSYQPGESQWAALRESQMSSLSVPNTAMATAIDLGEWNDLHPDRKKEVGERLAMGAEPLFHGKTVVTPGPVYRASTIKDDKMIISFDGAVDGLTTNDGEDPQEFAIAGADKKFVWARARIEGDKVVVWSETIKDPKYVRYAWSDEPVDPNLFNKQGVPASPFMAGE
ncbi:MAG: sialate O-acetylesterase [Bacteroidota bacterium]|nr:sialate O-acetylesterase [Bacteroidota bacterium]MDP4245433.1 sialate O-acetylesterase [Bacteroidota bacterium]MDP4255932.1 sialate O-acetylesterase [Bacteroidota bacterium]MDP4258537.1 sialate O-acetylesterase [Bacteroidota bacterium]